MNAVRLREGEVQHAALCEEVAALNRRVRAEHAEKVKARKAVEAENLARQVGGSSPAGCVCRDLFGVSRVYCRTCWVSCLP